MTELALLASAIQLVSDILYKVIPDAHILLVAKLYALAGAPKFCL